MVRSRLPTRTSSTSCSGGNAAPTGVTGPLRVDLPLSVVYEEERLEQQVATFEEDSVNRQADAEGFIRLNTPRVRSRAMVDQKAKR